jgi:hypothetical protein
MSPDFRFNSSEWTFPGDLQPPRPMRLSRIRPRVTPEPLQGVMVKIDRAHEHRQQLVSDVAAWSSRRPFEVVGEPVQNEGSAYHRVNLRIRENPPPRWAAIIGDIVHNLRSALDLLAWQLVLNNGGQPGRHTAFPIAETASGFEAQLRVALRGASAEAWRLTQLLKPYKDGNLTLYRVHALDIEDKHHVLMPTLIQQTAMGVTYKAADGSEGLTIWMGLPRPWAPVKDGSDLGMLRADQIIEGSKYEFKLAIAAEGVDREPLDAVLDQLGTTVQEVAGAYARRCF